MDQLVMQFEELKEELQRQKELKANEDLIKLKSVRDAEIILEVSDETTLNRNKSATR